MWGSRIQNESLAPPRSTRPTWAELDLAALRSNLRQVRACAAGRRIIAVVKAGAYGHGIGAVAPALVREGVEALAVATLEEARELRALGLVLPILLLEGLHRDEDAAEVIGRGFVPVIPRVDMLEAVAAAARTLRRRVPVHVKLDTGMARLGIQLEDLSEVVDRIRREPLLDWAGLMTHLAEADDAASTETSRQRDRFQRALDQVRSAGFDPGWIHADPSAAVLRGPTPFSTAVRPGLMLYGADPTLERSARLEPVMSLFSRAIQAKDVASGTRVGYGGTHVTGVPTRLLTLPIGYADGLPRAAGGRAQVSVAGAHARLVGRVSMDLAVVDVGSRSAADVGSEVLLFGRRGSIRVPVEELALAVDTIAYEILTGIGPRVPRLVVR